MSSEQSNSCPRCGQAVDVGMKYGQIKAHRDQLVKAACPTAGMTIPEARGWVDQERARIRAMAGSRS